jgi:hypothetical protein
VNTTMNFWVTSRGEEGDLLTTWSSIGFSRKSVLNGVRQLADQLVKRFNSSDCNN